MTANETLFRALHSTEGYGARWKAVREKGATDAEIKDLICGVFGIWGGFSGPGEPGCTYSGGTAPQFWIGDQYENGKRKKPTLSGQALVDATRRLLGIPLPKDHAQQMEMEL